MPYIEGLVGEYYAYSRYTFRLGERFNVHRAVQLLLDFEFTKIGQGRHSLSRGMLARLKCEWKPVKHVTASVYSLNNSFLRLTGIFASIRYSKNEHEVHIEYRDLRNTDFRNIETSNPLFCSRVLFQYRFHFKRV